VTELDHILFRFPDSCSCFLVLLKYLSFSSSIEYMHHSGGRLPPQCAPAGVSSSSSSSSPSSSSPSSADAVLLPFAANVLGDEALDALPSSGCCAPPSSAAAAAAAAASAAASSASTEANQSAAAAAVVVTTPVQIQVHNVTELFSTVTDARNFSTIPSFLSHHAPPPCTH
jgi:hypothetical protein